MGEAIVLDKADVIKMYTSNMSLEKIGDFFGVHRGTISRFLKKEGVAVRDSFDRTVIDKDKADETYRNKEWLIEEYANNHKSGYEIADNCGVKFQTIYRYLHKYCIDITNNGHNNIKDISGQRFGRLVAIALLETRTKDCGAIWSCKCDCGNLVNVATHELSSGHTKSCGCLNEEKRRENFVLGPESKVEDIAGRIFGRWLVLRRSENKGRVGSFWECSCECGNFGVIQAGALKSGTSKSCGCLQKESAEKKVKDIAGKKFGRWLVLDRAKEDERAGAFWNCICECGNHGIIGGGALRQGQSKSCGCLQRDTASEMCGENSPRWNPDLTDEERQNGRCYPEYTEWRIAVFERDNYTCQKCGGSSGVHLNAHHIESYDVNKDLRTTLENGVTLCADKCHPNFHHIYGYGHNTREQFNEFMLMEDTDARSQRNPRTE